MLDKTSKVLFCLFYNWIDFKRPFFPCVSVYQMLARHVLQTEQTSNRHLPFCISNFLLVFVGIRYMRGSPGPWPRGSRCVCLHVYAHIRHVCGLFCCSGEVADAHSRYHCTFLGSRNTQSFWSCLWRMCGSLVSRSYLISTLLSSGWGQSMPASG